ncbi:MAG: ABC transporter permease subunit [Oscillospiraceae bacterium]|jgi:NitT/TauT family transport system permease protein|nr:ABC transporter permease subunit [Oscillospiraceae bacterium]
MARLRRLLTVSNLLFIALLLLRLIPDRALRVQDHFEYTTYFAIALEAVMLAVTLTTKNDRIRHVFTDVIGFLFAFLCAWTLATAKFKVLNEAVFPPPGAVFQAMAVDVKVMFANIGSSLVLVFRGYVLALVIAIPLGLFLGWNVRVGSAAGYISKFLASISPIVYIPYFIVLLPTFRSASVAVMFMAAFWPTLASTMSGVLGVEKRILDSAKTLGVGHGTMLFRVVLPAALPQIFIGCNQGLSVSFILLTSAEMIGARSGMGYYVNNYANFGNYTRALAGVFVIGIVVTVITFFFNILQRWLLRWKR